MKRPRPLLNNTLWRSSSLYMAFSWPLHLLIINHHFSPTLLGFALSLLVSSSPRFLSRLLGRGDPSLFKRKPFKVQQPSKWCVWVATAAKASKLTFHLKIWQPLSFWIFPADWVTTRRAKRERREEKPSFYERQKLMNFRWVNFHAGEYYQ